MGYGFLTGGLPPENWPTSDVKCMGHEGGRKWPSNDTPPERIIFKLREADVALAQGIRVADVCRQLGITEQTYYRWRKEYGGLKTSQARQLKLLERENSRLKKLVADLSLDKQILSEALRGNF